MQTLFNKLCFKAILHRKAQDYAAQRSNSVFGMDARKKYSSERFGRGFGTFTRRGKPKIAGKHGFHRKRLYKTVQPLRVIRRLCYGNNRKTVCILRFSLLRRFHSGNKTEAKSEQKSRFVVNFAGYFSWFGVISGKNYTLNSINKFRKNTQNCCIRRIFFMLTTRAKKTESRACRSIWQSFSDFGTSDLADSCDYVSGVGFWSVRVCRRREWRNLGTFSDESYRMVLSARGGEHGMKRRTA